MSEHNEPILSEASSRKHITRRYAVVIFGGGTDARGTRLLTLSWTLSICLVLLRGEKANTQPLAPRG